MSVSGGTPIKLASERVTMPGEKNEARQHFREWADSLSACARTCSRTNAATTARAGRNMIQRQPRCFMIQPSRPKNRSVYWLIRSGRRVIRAYDGNRSASDRAH